MSSVTDREINLCYSKIVSEWERRWGQVYVASGSACWFPSRWYCSIAWQHLLQQDENGAGDELPENERCSFWGTNLNRIIATLPLYKEAHSKKYDTITNDSRISSSISHMVYPGGWLKVEHTESQGAMNVCMCGCSFESSHLRKWIQDWLQSQCSSRRINTE